MSLLDDIKFECTECGQRLVVHGDAAGLLTDCPSCRTALEVPGGTPPGMEDGGEAEIDPETYLLRQELSGAKILADERERQVAILHAKLTQARQEATGYRAERDWQTAALLEKETEFTTLQETARELRQKLRAEQEERELTRQLATGQAAQLASRETVAAEAFAAAETLRGEVRALEGRVRAIDCELAEARLSLVEKAELEKQAAQFREQLAAAEAVARHCDQLTEETASLKRQLRKSSGGKELLAVREQLRTAQETADCSERAASHALADAAKAQAALTRDGIDREGLRKRCEAAEKQAASHSESATESLRGIVDRQKSELLEQYALVARLRKAQYGVRLLHGVVALLTIGGLGTLALWVKHAGWLG